MEADLPAAIPAPPGETSAQKAIRHERNKAVRDATRIARDQANRDMAEQLADQSDELALLKTANENLMAELAESNRRRAKKGRKAPVAPVSSDEEDDDDLGAADGYRKPEGEHGVDFNIKTLLKIRTVEWKKVSGHLADAFSEAKIHPYKRSFKWVVENQGLNLELAIRSIEESCPWLEQCCRPKNWGAHELIKMKIRNARNYQRDKTAKKVARDRKKEKDRREALARERTRSVTPDPDDSE